LYTQTIFKKLFETDQTTPTFYNKVKKNPTSLVDMFHKILITFLLFFKVVFNFWVNFFLKLTYIPFRLKVTNTSESGSTSVLVKKVQYFQNIFYSSNGYEKNSYIWKVSINNYFLYSKKKDLFFLKNCFYNS